MESDNALKAKPPESEALERRDTSANGAQATASARWRWLFERLDHWFRTQRLRDDEAYLAKATDVYDLEARIRALARKGPHSYY